MSITKDFDIIFLVYKSCLVIRACQHKQAILKTIMNIRVHMILKTLLVFFRMAKNILKYHKGVHMRVKGFSTKKKNIK